MTLGSNEATLRPEDLPLLAGETIKYSVQRDVVFLCPYNGPMRGVLHVTNFRLNFRSNAEERFVLDVPLGVVSRIEKIGGVRSTGENSYGIEIFCKDMRTLRFAHKQENHSRRTVVENLHFFSFPVTNKGQFFALDHGKALQASSGGYNPSETNGWFVYDTERELRRMLLPLQSGDGQQECHWRISRVNVNYEVSETYPALWAVPAQPQVTDDLLRKVACFRSRGRIPVLSWLHPTSLASITRCAQPMVGVRANRSPADESYIQAILDANPHSHRIFIMDARPSVNAKANKARGGGFETEEGYPNAELVFLDIHNIHVMRESARKLQELCYPGMEDSHWLSSLASTQWLEHIRSILAGAHRIADKVENQKRSCVVHCSDGWDRTAQLTSLSMLMLDKFYRTLEGFQILIEKEWLAFGHKFAQRLGHGEDKPSDPDRSPVFLQFIDCVWQLTRQFPHGFEFNQELLLAIMDHVYSNRFGTFLYNCEAERRSQHLRETTESFWTWVNANQAAYKNPLFNNLTRSDLVLLPQTSARHIRLWKNYYCRWNPRMRPQEPLQLRNMELLILRDRLLARLEELRHREQQDRSRPPISRGHSQASPQTTLTSPPSARAPLQQLQTPTSVGAPGQSSNGQGQPTSYSTLLWWYICTLPIEMARRFGTFRYDIADLWKQEKKDIMLVFW